MCIAVGALVQSIGIYQDNSGDALEQFVLQHRPLVKKIALYVKRRLPSHIELDDLLQAGLIGLLEAKENYQSDMGTAFETFAGIRIRGAMIDSLRKSSCITRDTLRNMRRISEVVAKIEQRKQGPVSNEEIAAELGISIDEHFKMEQDINVCYLLSLEEIDYEHSGLIGNEEEDPQKLLQKDNIKHELKNVLSSLSEKEQLILSLYYVEEFTFKQIGEILELTEARVCQIHREAIIKVRKKMLLDKDTD